MKALIVVALLGGSAVSAQEAVRPIPDAISWATALANPVIGVVQAFRSEAPACHLGQLGIAGGIVVTAGLLGQHVIPSPRPCVGSPGCAGNGTPSLHAAISGVGSSRGIHSGLGITLSVSLMIGTAGGRVDAQRHNPKQAALGLLVGGLSELAGRTLLRCDR